MNYEEYYHECWSNVPASIVTDEYYEKNLSLLQAMTYDFYMYNDATGSLPPVMSSFLLQRVFSNMLSFGVR